MADRPRAHGRARHEKWPGFVDWIDPDGWWARLHVDGEELVAQFGHDRFPLPDGRGEGSYLVLHRTKAGRHYFHWVDWRPSAKQRKTARQRGRALSRALRGLAD